jgi:hypothetical protein
VVTLCASIILQKVDGVPRVVTLCASIDGVPRVVTLCASIDGVPRVVWGGIEFKKEFTLCASIILQKVEGI